MLKILVIEDEAHLARQIARVLHEEGYAAETDGYGRSALARALVNPFDLREGVDLGSKVQSTKPIILSG